MPLRRIAESITSATIRAMRTMMEKIGFMNAEVLKAAEEELDDPNRDVLINLYLTWSRKQE